MKNKAQHTKSAGYLVALILSFAMLFLVPGIPRSAQAAPGDIDPSFGSGTGKVTTAIGTFDAEVNSLAIQLDGKLVAAGYYFNGVQNEFALVRYNTDGSLDADFGAAGIVITAIGTDDKVNSLAIQSDGKLVAAGYSNNGGQNNFALVRYNGDGSRDTSFGTDGIVTTAIGTNDQAFALAIQSDGKMVAAGYSTTEGAPIFALVRYNTDGTLDTGFGSEGVVTTPIGANPEAFALAIQSDGKLVAAGVTLGDGNNDFALVRYNTDGTLDTSFGTGGKVTTDFANNDDDAKSLVIQSDGKLVLGGFAFIGTQHKFPLARYNTDGSLDMTFGTGGIVTTAIGTVNDKVKSLAIQSDGKLLAAGYSYNGSQYEFALVRYNTDGGLDTTFGTGGIVTTAIGTIDDEANALAIQPDGKLVAAGFSDNGDQIEFALVRYLGGLTIIIPPGASLCTADYNSTCAFAPNPLTIESGDSVVWSNTDSIAHTATSDDHADNITLDQPVAPGNSFSTALMSGGTSSSSIGPFINTTGIAQTKLYHCSLHPNMKGTLIINSAPVTTTTTTVATTTTTVATTTTTVATTTTTVATTTTTVATTMTTVATTTTTVATTTTTVATTTTTVATTTTTVATTTTTVATTTTTVATTTTTVATTTTTVATTTTTVATTTTTVATTTTTVATTTTTVATTTTTVATTTTTVATTTTTVATTTTTTTVATTTTTVATTTTTVATTTTTAATTTTTVANTTTTAASTTTTVATTTTTRPTTTTTTSTTTTTLPGFNISSFTPNKGIVGTSVTISGKGFTGATDVQFYGTSAAVSIEVLSSTRIRVLVPTGACPGTGPISVITPSGTATSAHNFTCAATITSFAPNKGPALTNVIINGTGFTGTTAVQFNMIPATTFTVLSPTRIQATVPAGACPATGTISVSTPSGTVTSTNSLMCAATITSFAPNKGPALTNVIINGTGFTGTTAVQFNMIPATTFTVLSPTRIQATVPTGACPATGTISVLTLSGTVTSTKTFMCAATITSFTPNKGPAGTIVTISGTGFTGTTAVQFNMIPATTFTVQSPTRIQATVPAGACPATGTISVLTLSGTVTSTNNFTCAATITSFTPSNGSVGKIVTISGTGFTGTISVQFNMIPATTFTVQSPTRIQATVPAGATTGPISVITLSGTVISARNFTITTTVTTTTTTVATTTTTGATTTTTIP